MLSSLFQRQEKGAEGSRGRTGKLLSVLERSSYGVSSQDKISIVNPFATIRYDSVGYGDLSVSLVEWGSGGILGIMRYLLTLLLAVTSALAIDDAALDNMVMVPGGIMPISSELSGQIVATFAIGKYEVTWDEWQKVRIYAVAQGYDLDDIGYGSAGNHPVRVVNWYDCVKWCNAKSEMEGFTPVYQVSGVTYKTGQSDPTIVEGANGYRLPSEAEWEWAARGGVSSHGYVYSGSSDLNAVGWYWNNSDGAAVDQRSGRGTWPVGQKQPNELGIYDMSGNVWEWCFDRFDSSNRCFRGGSWSNGLSDRCAVVFRGINKPGYRDNGGSCGYKVGFRTARSLGN